MDIISVKNVAACLNRLVPLAWAESFDNVGLLTGNPDDEVRGVLVALDSTEEVVREAIERGCNMIVAFHPILLKGLKKLTGQTYVERALMLAIKNDISIYAVHTALDNDFDGVSASMCDALGLTDRQILIPKEGQLKKIVTYVPHSHLQDVRQAVFAAGAGSIGNYDCCSFNTEGTGTFRANDKANPFVGKPGEIHHETETCISAVFPSAIEKQVVAGMLSAHPYEEVAYEVFTLDNPHKRIGMGMTGFVEHPLDEMEFLDIVKEKFACGCVRHSALRGKKIEKVAVLGGSGSFAIGEAIACSADILLTADLKYHDFFCAEGSMVLADIGHYESEQFTKIILMNHLKENFTNFATCLSRINTNPINYL